MRELTDNDFEMVMASEKPVLIDFYATWCQPCKTMSPIVAETAEEWFDEVATYKIDVEKSPLWVKALGITSMPTFTLLKDGHESARVTGAMPKGAFIAWLDASL